MKQKLVTTIVYIFFACRFTGLTSYYVKKNSQGALFKTTKLSRCVNIAILIIIATFFVKFDQCVLSKDAIETVSSHIAHLMFFIYFVVLLTMTNLKQRHIVQTFEKIIIFDNFINEVTGHNIDVSKILKYYVVGKCLGVPVIAALHMLINGLRNVIAVSCFLRFFAVHFIIASGEVLLFCYLVAAINGMKKFNFVLRKRKEVRIEQIQQMLELCFDIKKDIESISQIFGFFKLLFSIVEVATTLYTVLTRLQKDDVLDYIANVHWIFELFMQACIFLAPFVIFYKTVSCGYCFQF